MSFRLRRVCRLRKGQGKSLVVSGAVLVARERVTAVACAAQGAPSFMFTAWTQTTLRHLSRAGADLLDRGEATIRCLFSSRIRRLMLFLHFVVASGISMRSGLWTTLTCALICRQRTWMWSHSRSLIQWEVSLTTLAW